MRQKVTVQDIADALELSRTTVSKVLNNSPAVSDVTRTMVLEKARELGYRVWGHPEAPAVEETEVSSFALVMHAIPGGNHMGTVIIPNLDRKLRQEGITLITCTVSDEDYEAMQLPPILSHSQTKAILCLELFNPEYSKLICSLGKPAVFIDACRDFHKLGLNADLLLMENRSSVNQMLTTVVKNHGVKTMGFVGDKNHCVSFRERFEAFLLTAAQQQAVWQPYSIIDDDEHYGDVHWIQQKLEEMQQLPELLFCANDFLAESVIQSLTVMGKRVPEDVMVCGFDGVASITWPLSQLTTVVTPTDQIGTCAADIMLWKLTHGEPASTTIYLNTSIQYRKSTQ